MKLANIPPKWTQDWYPEDFQIRKYIFDTWRKVCTQFGYQEYLGPLVENADIWRAKSWEDVWGSELTLITNRDWEISDLALRPEMTPTVTRMVSRKYTQLPKPIRYFSIANFYRNERPQRGRNREFWQLNVDMFGADSLNADIEILQIAMEIMKSFDAPKDSWELSLNNRYLIDYILDSLNIASDTRTDVVRLMDKWEKLTREVFIASLVDKWLDQTQVDKIINYMEATNLEDLNSNFEWIQDSKGYQQSKEILDILNNMWYGELIKFKPSLIRGFDYYDGMVFEVFDKHPDNNRALFWWGRYNGLAEIFGSEAFPAVGFAPWDEAMKLFLESWEMFDSIRDKVDTKSYYVPLLDDELTLDTMKLANNLRSKWYNIEQWLETQKFGKAMQYAEKRWINYVVIFGSMEKENNQYKIKNLETWEEEIFDL